MTPITSQSHFPHFRPPQPPNLIPCRSFVTNTHTRKGPGHNGPGRLSLEILRAQTLRYGLTMRTTVVLLLLFPPVPVMVMMRVPMAASGPAEITIVEVPEPGSAMEVGERVALTPGGNAETDKETGELKPLTPTVVMVTLAEPLLSMESSDGKALMVKFEGAVAVTVRLTVVV